MAITDQNAERELLVTLEPSTDGGSTTTPLYVGTRDYTTEPTDSPANTLFLGVVTGRPSFRRSLFRPGRIGGLSIPGRGSIVLRNGALPGSNVGELDAWLSYLWPGRRFTTRLKEVGSAFSTAEIKAKGFIADLDYDRGTITLPIRDRQDQERLPFASATYTGAGGFNGGDDLTGKRRPYGYGLCRNVPAVLVDTANRWYDLHNGQIDSVISVRDNGVDYPSDASNPPASGKHYQDLTNGRIRLGNVPAGTVTVDFRGSKYGGTYVSAAATIFRRMAVLHLGLTDPTDLDTSSFTALGTANSSEVGIWTGTEVVSFGEVADRLLDSVGAFRTFTEADLLQVGRIEAPDIVDADDADCALAIGPDDIVRDSMKRVNPGLPPSEIVLKYRKNWSPQDPDAIAAAVSAADRLLYSEEWRQVVAAAASASAYPTAASLVLESLIDDATAAGTEASRLATMLGTRRDVFQMTLGADALALALNDQVWLTHDGFGLSAGRAGRVIGTDPDWVNGRNTVEIWC